MAPSFILHLLNESYQIPMDPDVSTLGEHLTQHYDFLENDCQTQFAHELDDEFDGNIISIDEDVRKDALAFQRSIPFNLQECDHLDFYILKNNTRYKLVTGWTHVIEANEEIDIRVCESLVLAELKDSMGLE